MRYWTHWHNVRYELSKFVEHKQMWFVARLPKWVVYHATIRAGVHATTGKYSDTIVSELTFFEVLQRWKPE